ncbi:MAG: 2-dehydropantoate 2-reductase [Peptococcaceae bacterium]|nr:2-dehydropantoate 2-reductase [Peptococcaceae bacterium]
MKFVIFGAGTMGALVGALLTKAGEEVILVDKSDKVIAAIRQNGVKVTLKNTEEAFRIPIVKNAAEIKEKPDVILFLVKGLYTEAAAKEAQILTGPDTYVLTVQNGVGNADILAQYYDNAHVLHGILEFAGKLIEPGVVVAMISENSVITFGPINNVLTPEMNEIGAVFAQTGIKVMVKENVDGDIWVKMRNNMANALMGVVRLTIGQAMEVDVTDDLLKKVRNECIQVAEAKGVKFSEENLKVLNKKAAFNAELAAHLPSTAQDMKNHLLTEIEFLNGAVYHEGQKLGIPTPYNETLYKLVRIIERSYDQQFA